MTTIKGQQFDENWDQIKDRPNGEKLTWYSLDIKVLNTIKKQGTGLLTHIDKDINIWDVKALQSKYFHCELSRQLVDCLPMYWYPILQTELKFVKSHMLNTKSIKCYRLALYLHEAKR